MIDNAREYTSNEFDDFCQQIGIKRQFTTTYTPQQNRVAEQMNKTHLEITRAMLKAAFLGKPYWLEIVKTICYVISQSPSTAIDLKTPIKMWIRNPIGYS
jgi:transposase InsO family protein